MRREYQREYYRRHREEILEKARKKREKKAAVDERKAFDRLAAYEETMPLERVQELAQAEKDGRLVVLNEPRKPLVWGDDTHDTILCPNCNHDLMGGFPEDEYCEKDMYQCPYCGQSIDSTKAITREDAEAALKKREEENTH